MTSIIHQSDTYIKSRNRNPRNSGAQAAFARAMGYSSSLVYDMVRGRVNASPTRAREIEKETGSPMDIWLFGGDYTKRRPAVEAWHKRTLASSGSSLQGAPAAGPNSPVPPPPE